MSEQPIENGDVTPLVLNNTDELRELLRFTADDERGFHVGGKYVIDVKCPCCGWNAHFFKGGIEENGK